MSRIITVFGATGAQGGGLARAILADPQRRFRVRAVTRKPESPAARALAEAGADIIVADLDDAVSVRRAMEGAHGAFCVTNFWEHFSPRRAGAGAHDGAGGARCGRQARRVVNAGRHARIHYARQPHAGADGQVQRAALRRQGRSEPRLHRRGLPTTLLYTSFYWDNLIHFGMQPQRGADGVLNFVLPMGEAKRRASPPPTSACVRSTSSRAVRS